MLAVQEKSVYTWRYHQTNRPTPVIDTCSFILCATDTAATHINFTICYFTMQSTAISLTLNLS